MRRGLLSAAALAALLAATPAVAQAPVDLPSPLRPRPLPAKLAPEGAAPPSVEFTARSGRPVWLLPAAGLVAGAVLYPMLVDGGCEDGDCMLYIPEPVTGAIVGLLGGILLEVSLMVLGGDLSSPPGSLLPASASESTTPAG